MKQIALAALAALVLVAGACDGSWSVDAPVAEASVRVDSIVPVEEALQRFRDGMVEPQGLEGGASSRDALVREFVRAVEKLDTAAVQAMVVGPAEFAYLYYPTSPYASPPTRMYPEILWMLTQANSQKGITRVLRRLGGRPFGDISYACEDEPAPEGENRLWHRCTLRHSLPSGETVEMRYFGSIIERDGRYKFLSYANGL